jgi:hypothetical protein
MIERASAAGAAEVASRVLEGDPDYVLCARSTNLAIGDQ